MYRTALSIIQTAASEMALAIPQSIESTTDPGTIQLINLLNSAGYELCSFYPWQQLSVFQNITTVEGQQAYDLPQDWFYYIDQAHWNKSSNGPIIGPISAQEWQWVENDLVSSVSYTFRIMRNKLNILPLPAAGIELSLNYISNGWVEVAGTPGVFKSTVSKNDDMPILDWILLVKYLKLKLFQSRGLDTTAYTAEFTNWFDSLTGKDVGAPVLSIAGNSGQIHLINAANVPSGSWQV
jgi:hypothetical protein